MEQQSLFDEQWDPYKDDYATPQKGSRLRASAKVPVGSYLRPLTVITGLLWGTVVLIQSILALSSLPSNGYTKYSDPSPPATSNDGRVRISLCHIRNSTFTPKMHTVQWLNRAGSEYSDKGLYFDASNGTYVVKSVFDTEYTKTLWEGKGFRYQNENFTVDYLEASPDLEKLLIRSNTIKNWRHSTYGSYFIYDSSSSEISLVAHNASLVEWSPDSRKVGFVRDNDIYIRFIGSAEELRVTDDGSGQLFNGRPDWVYEEEVLESDKALWWSEDGQFLAFYKIDETNVGKYVIPYYIQHTDDVYPEMREIRYPKSGTPNPQVEVCVYNIHDKSTFAIGVNKGHDEQPVLVTELVWVGDGQFITKTTDRSSDNLNVLLIDATRNTVQTVREDSAASGWWEITHETKFVPKNETLGRKDHGYVDVMPVDGNNHLVYFSPPSASNPIILTNGDWEVIDGAMAIDYEESGVYFLATKQGSTQRHIYYVSLDEPGKIVDVTQVKEEGVFSATFSAGGRFALLSYLGPKIPYQKVIDLQNNDTDKTVVGNVIGKTVTHIETNAKLKETVKGFAIPRKQIKELDLGKDENGDSIIANAFEILPPDFDPSLRSYYPVFFYAYGGPNSQQVLDVFSIGFNEVIATQLNCIVVVVDGRGTAAKGKKFRSLVRDKLGYFEAIDQISAAKLYSEKSFVDASKISLFGWSYGGYLTLKVLEKDAGEHFKYGMSVAPVTDWSLYDSVYTERYMHTPQQNPSGYESSQVKNVTSISHAKRFLLMHGTGDDNVHFQNSMKFLDKLNMEGVENYDVHVFPDSDHSIRFHNANTIVYDKLLNWARQAFRGDFIQE